MLLGSRAQGRSCLVLFPSPSSHERSITSLEVFVWLLWRSSGGRQSLMQRHEFLIELHISICNSQTCYNSGDDIVGTLIVLCAPSCCRVVQALSSYHLDRFSVRIPDCLPYSFTTGVKNPTSSHIKAIASVHPVHVSNRGVQLQPTQGYALLKVQKFRNQCFASTFIQRAPVRFELDCIVAMYLCDA